MLKKTVLLGVFLFSTMQIFAQTYFNLKGKVKNLDENFISFTLYKNWVEEPKELTLKVDTVGNYALSIQLNDIAYCDVNYGAKGFYNWKIEPNDSIEVNVDVNDFENSLKIYGAGSAKWIYLAEQKKKYEVEKDWDYEIQKYNNLSKEGLYKLTKFLLEDQNNLLAKYKDVVSQEFYSLQLADIYGKISNYELEYLVANKKFNFTEFNTFHLKTFNSKIQDKSLEFGLLAENLLDNLYLKEKKAKASNMDEFETFKNYFVVNDFVGKASIDRILADKILSYIDINGSNEESQIIVGSYKEFSKNMIYTNAVIQKLNNVIDFQPNKLAKEFILKNDKGNFVSLKDYRGKNVFLSFYASWCGPCVSDLSYLEIVNNYFKAKKDFTFIAISVDSPEDYKEFIKTNPFFGVSLSIGQNATIRKDYNVDSVPRYVLIDKAGVIISQNLVDPSLDEGRAIIKQIEQLVYQK